MKKFLALIALFTIITINHAQIIFDIDGNVYDTIKIGTQTWLKENLKTTRFNDGSAILKGRTALTIPNYCWYGDDSAKYNATYGLLYNWYTVDSFSNGNKNICPVGWRVSTNADWTILINYLGGLNIAGGKLKEIDTTHWQTPNTGATNESGFTALPGGLSLDGMPYLNIRKNCFFWTSTEASSLSGGKYIVLFYNSSSIYNSEIAKEEGQSVRCIKVNNTSIKNTNYSDEMIFYPNPANNRLYIKNDKYSYDLVMIYNLLGNLVINVQTGSKPIDISNLSKGTYLVKIIYSGNIVINKLIKE